MNTELVQEALVLHSKLSTLYWQEYAKRDKYFRLSGDPTRLKRLDLLKSKAADRWRRRRQAARPFGHAKGEGEEA